MKGNDCGSMVVEAEAAQRAAFVVEPPLYKEKICN